MEGMVFNFKQEIEGERELVTIELIIHSLY